MSTTSRAERRWFRRNLQPSTPFRLFCFPHAGGSASIYRNWHDWLAPAIEVVAVELPGRGMHIGEPAIDRMDVLVEQVVAAMRPLLDRRFALFGHSLGSLVAFEVSRKLAAAGGPEPQHLVVSGMGAPHVVAGRSSIHELPDDEFIEAVRALDGIPAEVLASEALVECFLEVLRADFRLAGAYQCARTVPLRHPITAFGGVDDQSCRREDLEAWQQHTEAQCVVRWLPGGHFFIREHEPLVAASLIALASFEPKPAPSAAGV
jgi:medium-chain acyl-[acyl-carrier-protein] hydrolase